MSKGVGDQNDSAAIVAGKIVEQMNDFAFGAGIEPAGHLVTKEKLGIRDKLHCESEASLLSAGEDPDVAVGNRSEAGLLQDAVDTLVELLSVATLDTKASCGLDRFIDSELVVGDGELRNVADLPGLQVAVLREIAPVPPERACGLGIQASDRFK